MSPCFTAAAYSGILSALSRSSEILSAVGSKKWDTIPCRHAKASRQPTSTSGVKSELPAVILNGADVRALIWDCGEIPLSE